MPAPELNPAGRSRRSFLQTAALAAAAPALHLRPQRALAPEKPFVEVKEKTVAELQEGMASGAYTSADLCAAYMSRIDALDRKGPELRAVLEVNPDALGLARALDEERAAGRVRGPLHGIPVLVKDNIDTGDRMMTTAGSLALAGTPAASDAFIIERLRAAGAVILGKTNLSEWANFRSTKASSGWSGRGGQCRNPYALDRSPCGSSSGSGSGIAASFAAVGVGTETDGSITCPAAAASLVGIKPTLGLVSRAGIVPLAHSQDTAGPMARTVRDAVLLLGAMAGADPRDAATSDAGIRGHADYTPFLDPDGLRGARIGIPREKFFGYSREADRVAEEAIEAMRRAGAVIIEPANIPNADGYDASEFEVLLYEFKHDLNAYLATRRGLPVGSLADCIAFNEANREREMPFFGQEIFHMAEAKGPLTDQAYVDALALNHRLSREEGLDKVLDEHRLDALVMPTGSPVWPIDVINGDHYTGSASSPAAVAGYPHITVPGGYAFGLPVGISFVGRAWSEPTLIRLAYGFEQATRHRVAPSYLPTALTL